MIPYQPNGVNFFNLMKEKLKNEENKITVYSNQIRLIGNFTEEEFIQDIHDLDMSKKDIADSDEEDVFE